MLGDRGWKTGVEAVKSRLARGYSRSAPHYDELAGPMYAAGLRRVLPHLRVPPMPAILDVGSGTGLNLIEAARWFRSPRLLRGIDISPGMVAVARAKAAALGLPAEFVVGDAERLPYPDGLFDLVICNSVFHWFKERAAALREMARVLRPGGQLVLLTATKPGFGEWFNLVDSVMGLAYGPAATTAKPDLPTGLDVGLLMAQNGFRVERIRNPIHQTMVHDPGPFVKVMSVIAPHWAADLSDPEVERIQHLVATAIARGWPQGFPVTWAAVEAIGTKI